MSKKNADKIRTVLVGTGAIGREHISALTRLANVELAGICDLSPARARATAHQFNIAKYYNDFDQMIAEVSADWVHITTPPQSHFKLVKRSLESGLNVICEKPIVNKKAEFSELTDIASKKNLFLLENQNFRFHSSVIKIMRLVDSGELGNVIDVQVLWNQSLYFDKSPYTDPLVPHYALELGGGVIGDFLPHLSYLATMFAGQARNVSTYWRKRHNGSPLPFDEFRALIDCELAPALVAFSASSQPDGVWLRISGTRMYVEANLFDPPRIQIRRHRHLPQPLPALFNGMGESYGIARDTFASIVRKLSGKSQYDGLEEFVNEVYSAFGSGKPMPVSTSELSEHFSLVQSLTDPDTRI